jgi:(4-O-methyl)-D-glucuronate---lignin esterase
MMHRAVTGPTRVAALVALATLGGGTGAPAPGAAPDALERGFLDPPASARPRVWWHWMNGNVTREGITADLEWMKRVGIGGVQMFDASIGNVLEGQWTTPQFVQKRIVYHTPEWKEMLRHAAAECDRLGLEMTMHTSGGWSETGGPWVRPEQAMKKLVWSETRVDGPRRFSAVLAAPPSVNGNFQDLPFRPMFGEALPQAPGAPVDPTHYGDSAVVAYRVREGQPRMSDEAPKVTASGGPIRGAVLFDGDLVKTAALPRPEGGAPAWIQFEFARPFTARAITIAMGSRAMPRGSVQASEDGTRFATLAALPGPSHFPLPVRTYAFPETAARFYRVEFTAPVRGQFDDFFGAPPVRQYDVAEVELHAEPRLNRWHEKAGFAAVLDPASMPTPGVSPVAAITRADVVDLTAKMGPDGRLDWDVPGGQWVVLRMGYSLTSQKNGPAPVEATGYEVDKLSRKHVASYYDAYLAPISEAMGPLLGKSLQYLLVDSWEAGMQNWSEEILAEFATRRGYDPKPYLPVLTGRVVDSSDVSERFLWDFRRTIADVLADYHYAMPAELLRKRGLKLYGEAAGANSPMLQDALQNKARVDIPMGEFWTLLPGQGHRPEHVTDIREAASAAHVYGKPLVAAESFTSFVPGWNDAPSRLKWLGDYYMSLGVNRFVIHTSVHQPFLDRRPGMTLGPFGQHYTRHNTWAEQSRGWIADLTRSSYLLQQGLFVGDLAYYYGEGAPASVYVGDKTTPSPEPPAGYAYDYVNTEALLTRFTVKDGRLVLPDGMSYRVLVLPDGLHRLTAPAARKIRELVAGGAIVAGPRPQGSPSLVGFPTSDREVRSIGNEVWGDCDGRTVTEHAYGQGKVYCGRPLAEVLAAAKTPPDVEYSRPHVDTTLAWIHRQVGDTQVYFVANQKDWPEELDVRFRVDGKAAELWHPETAEVSPAAYTIEAGRTTVPLSLGPHEAVFVVFREAATTPTRVRPRAVSTELATVTGPWTVSFPPNQGAPAQIRLDDLASWTTNADEGVKYFSGTATYAKTLEASPAWFRPGAKLGLDLGTVKDIAEVSVNGQPAVLVWRPPYRADVSGALRPGPNRIEIKVTNLWANRMIGDQGLPEEKRYTFSMFKPYKKDSPLLESGLLGPVKLTSTELR